MAELAKALAVIQQKLVAPKGERNTFAKFNYRTCEGILEAVKPLLNGHTLILTDDMVEVAGKAYVKATAQISDGKSSIEVHSFAREAQTKKGMDEAQMTGTASSYARKYALSGLFAIDGNDDVDSMDNSKAQDDARHAAQADCMKVSRAVNSSNEYFNLPKDRQTACWNIMIDDLKAKINNGQ